MQDVRRDAELLDDLLSAAPLVCDRVTGVHVVLSAKQIAAWTDRSVQMISQYKNGQTNIPVDFWRHVLRHYCDIRIVALLCPDNCLIEVINVAEQSPETAPAFFRQAVESEIEHHDKQRYLAELLADGRIDELDELTVRNYDDAFHSHRTRDAALHRAVIHAWNRAVAAKARGAAR